MKLLMYEPNIFDQFNNEQEEKETEYNNKEEIKKKNYNGNGKSNSSMNTESQRRKQVKGIQLKSPVMTYSNTTQNERIKTEGNAQGNPVLKLKKQNNKQYPMTQTKTPIAKLNEITTNKTQINSQIKPQNDNCEITLNHQYENENNATDEYNQKKYNDYHYDKKQQMFIQTEQSNHVNDRVTSMQDEWNYDDQYNEGDIIESNNEMILNPQLDDTHRRRKDKSRKISSSNSNQESKKNVQSDYHNKNIVSNNNESNQYDSKNNKSSPKRITGDNKIEPNALNSNDSNTKRRSNENDDQPHRLFNQQSSGKEIKELMIKFQLTEEEYGRFVEAKSKMIMKYLADVSKNK